MSVIVVFLRPAWPPTSSFNNNYEGVTITASDHISLSNVEVYGNAINNSRENIRVVSGNYSKMLNINSHDCPTTGIRYYAGVGHTIDNSEIHSCNGGIYADSSATIEIGNGVKIHDITMDGITLVTNNLSSVYGCEVTTCGRYGIYVSGGTNLTLLRPNSHDNTTDNVYLASNPSFLQCSYLKGGVIYKELGHAEFRYKKDSVADEVNTNVASFAVPLSGRVVIDFLVTGVYPSSSSSSVISVRGLATVSRTSGGTMVNNVSTTLLSASSISGVVSQTLTVTITQDEANNKAYLTVNQNNESLDGASRIVAMSFCEPRS